MSDVNYFGQLSYRGRHDRFGIRIDDRRRHMYVIGKTGMGKTALLKNMAIQDVVNGNGLGIIDPHGEFVEEVLHFIPENRVEDVVYFNPADYEHPIGLNLLEDVGYDRRHLVASGLMGVFKKIWVDVWSARMEYILNNAILALLEYPNATLLDVNRMLSNKKFRKAVVNEVTDPVVKSFWTEEFAQYSDRLAAEATAAIQNKVGQFTTAPLIRNIVGQRKSTIDFRTLMDEGKILVLNLSKGYIGEDNSRLLGAMTITKIYLAAMSRIDTPENSRRDFFLYVDEFQNFASEAFEGILSEARKYRLSLILTHQYIAQMSDEVRDAVFGNVGTLITFRVGAEDAEAIEKEFAPEFTAEDLVNTPKYNIVLKLMIEGMASHAFSAQSLPPFELPEYSYRDAIISQSRQKYGTPRQQIEEQVMNWNNFLQEQPHQQHPAHQHPVYRNNQGQQQQANQRHKERESAGKSQQQRYISLNEAHKKYPPPQQKHGDNNRGGQKNKKHNRDNRQNKKDANPQRPKRAEADVQGLRGILQEIEENKKDN